ncbi:MAG TPA: hypothetical protein VKU38_18915 [Ktedonobacteraceae bacterium]|nr:hypothetical protein [Ktedonobacteraceae bacterium]
MPARHAGWDVTTEKRVVARSCSNSTTLPLAATAPRYRRRCTFQRETA